MIKILLDTDVILDFFFDRQPYSEDAAKILSLCELKKIEVFITPVILSNVYYLVKKTATHAHVVNQLKILMSIINILIISKETVFQALNSSFKDFEDALQNYAAEADNSVNMIITRNVKDYKESALSVQTPDTFLHAMNTILD